MRETRGAVFDLDDTLLASGPVWAEGWREYSTRAGRDWSSQDTQACMGSGHWSSTIASWCGTEVAEVEQWCTAYMIEAIEGGRIALLDGAIELLAAAADRVPAGLASAAPRPFVAAAVAAFDLDGYLTTIVYADEVRYGKPAPDIYLRAAERLGAAADRCIGVEDSGSGIIAAHAAGMRVLAVPSPFCPPPSQALALASHRAGSTLEAVKILINMIEGGADDQ